MLQIWYYPSAKIEKIIFSSNNTFKGDISGITEKNNIHHTKYSISVEVPYWLTFKIEILERVPMILCIFFQNVNRHFTILRSHEKKET